MFCRPFPFLSLDRTLVGPSGRPLRCIHKSSSQMSKNDQTNEHSERASGSICPYEMSAHVDGQDHEPLAASDIKG